MICLFQEHPHAGQRQDVDCCKENEDTPGEPGVGHMACKGRKFKIGRQAAARQNDAGRRQADEHDCNEKCMLYIGVHVSNWCQDSK